MGSPKSRFELLERGKLVAVALRYRTQVASATPLVERRQRFGEMMSNLMEVNVFGSEAVFLEEHMA